MPRISTIPQPYIQGFEKIAKLDDSFFTAIEEGFKLTALVSSLSMLANKIAEVKKIDEDDIEDIFTSIGSLIPFLKDSSLVAELSEDIATVLTTTLKGKTKKPKGVIKQRLSFLLNSQHIYYAAKASDLITESENVYIRARLVTDIRPVFDKDLKENVIAGMVIHHLHIHYQSKEEGPHNDIYISLDSNDIKSLKEHLIRAEDKEKALKSVFQKAGLTNLDE